MNRIYRYLSIFLILFLNSWPQTFAQDLQADSLKNIFSNYHYLNVQEKTFLHTDRTFYLVGETIWFSIYVVDASSHKLLGISKVCYVEIINKLLKPVWQSGIPINDGGGSGSFAIPHSFVSGQYKLRAYTNWMKNSSADFYFEQDITIVNTFKATVFRDTVFKKAAYDLQFFPEGGDLVEGFQSVIAFKAVDTTGKGIDCSGIILNERHDTVASFVSLHSGMGRFILTPKRGEVYSAITVIRGKVIRTLLPAVHSLGYALHIAEVDTGRIKVTVHSKNEGDSIFLLVNTRQKLSHLISGMLINEESIFYVNKSELIDGISHFTIFNSRRRPVCERLYFKSPNNRLIIEATSKKQEYGIRQPIDINLSTTDMSGRQLGSRLSMSVYRIDELQELPFQEILSYLLLSSELKGKIEFPEYYFNSSDINRLEALDNLLLTQGWRRFLGEEVITDNKPLFEFLPEYEGPIITGRVTNRKTGTSAADIPFFMSIQNVFPQLREATSNSNSIIRFSCNNFFGTSEIIFQPVNYRDSLYTIDISSSFSDLFSSRPFPLYWPDEKWKNQLQYRSINSQAENAYHVSKKLPTFFYTPLDTIPFYGKPDRQYRLDDYTHFQTMEEVMHEFVMNMRVQKKDDKFYFRAWNNLLKTYFDNGPLILLDGLPIFDENKIMKLDPAKMKSIEIKSGKFYFGDQVNEGIISYKTYQTDSGQHQLDPSSVLLEYNGLQQQSEFYSPIYENIDQVQNRIPDFRDLLYWSPLIKVTLGKMNSVKFYSSDLRGKYAILVQGISNEGLAGSKLLFIDVR